MFRKLGILAAVVMAAAMTAGAFAPASASVPTGAAMADSSDDSAADSSSARKGMKEPQYAARLHSKLKKESPPGPKPKYKLWNKVITKEHTKQDGLIPIYTKQEEVYFVLKKDMLDKPMLAILSLSQGIGSNFVYGGLPVDDVMFDFHREEDHILLRRLSTLFRAPGDKELENALRLTFSESILESFEIASEKGDEIAIEVSKFYLSDIAGMGSWLSAALSQPVRQDSRKGYFASIHNYPLNTEIDTRLTYTPSRPEALHLAGVPDARFLQIGVHYSIRKLPEVPMTPRVADDRVGYFTTSHKDFTREKKESFFVHYANRWRLEKKDSTAAVSEPKQPIVFYLDRTIPKAYEKYIKEGVELWQRAFEEAGFKNAIIAKPAPTPEEDPAYDPEDARYNTIRWNVSDGVSYGAIGPSRVDPRTGEIIDADILFEHAMIANFGKGYRRMSAPRAALMELDPCLKELWMTDEERAAEVTMDDIPQLRGRGSEFCSIAQQMLFGGHFQALAMMANGFVSPDGEMPEEFVGEALRFVAAHEVGHTIGLRHNFMSSGATPYAELNDKARIKEIGMTGSVMDYPTANVALNSSQQGYYYTPTVGTADRWSIKWGYSEVAGKDEWEQSANLDPVAAACTEKANLYGTDEDTYPVGALDPRSNTGDLSDDPMAWAKERIAICDQLLTNGSLDERVVADGDNYVALRSAVQTLLAQKYVAAVVAVKNVGGQYVSRAHKGGGTTPLQPISAAKQMEALSFLLTNGLNSQQYQLPAEMLNKLGSDRMWSWENNLFALNNRVDFPLSGWVANIQAGILIRLMSPFRQDRVLEAEYKSDRPFKLSYLYSELTRTIWTSNVNPRGKTAAWDRNLQRMYADILIYQMTTPSQYTPEEAVALSRLNLKRVRTAAAAAMSQQGLDDDTNAHLMETVARIDRALDARRTAQF